MNECFTFEANNIIGGLRSAYGCPMTHPGGGNPRVIKHRCYWLVSVVLGGCAIVVEVGCFVFQPRIYMDNNGVMRYEEDRDCSDRYALCFM